MSFHIRGKAISEQNPLELANIKTEAIPVGPAVACPLWAERLATSNKRSQIMNRWTGVGTLPRAAVLSGKDKNVLKFTLCTVLGFNEKTKKERLAFVPCTVFRPGKALIQMLTEYHKGMVISIEGHIGTSKYQGRDGKTRYSTNVVVDPFSVNPVDLKQINTDRKEKAA